MSAMHAAERALIRLAACSSAVVTAGGCSGVQSTFSAFGVEAESTLALTLGMSIAAALITLGVGWLAFHAVRTPGGRLGHTGALRMILWLGAVIPTTLLTILLVIALPRMRTLPVTADTLEVTVDGEQFWWRVLYRRAAGDFVETANEVRLPVGRTVRFLLASPDVVHSFWIPGLAGKMDMIPGRTNELVVRAARAGVYRGVCAEFCGLSHARMAFDVVVMEQGAFDAWLAAMARPAAVVADAPGEQLFDAYGCVGCHVVRGVHAGTPIGPDLTHLGSRLSLAAGALPLDHDSVRRFIRDPAAIKPGALMPAFREMPDADVDAIAAWLVGLR